MANTTPGLRRQPALRGDDDMATLTTLTIKLRAAGRTIVKYPVNQYAAEREARDMLRTWKGDTKIRKTLSPNTITLTHRETYDKAIITLEDI
jgi:hypothetical protein